MSEKPREVDAQEVDFIVFVVNKDGKFEVYADPKATPEQLYQIKGMIDVRLMQVILQREIKQRKDGVIVPKKGIVKP